MKETVTLIFRKRHQ